ncbi:restriction endonuclease subunit S [Acinetobacter sp. NIPH1876]|uniref:restriction endonuclease subunit S n=1 Tax=unclassified Acinetobacter TaxID=196816 RepID=UPI001FAE5770|nr:restriction endonuclease subunit S [Acinetobacter sp. NIPH1876]MCJ0829848.1 restriction endonuclease subunit S [Acinetobacter sp. NIPH1876]
MSQLPRYESYKDSGVQWLGEIPSHWDVKRMKFVVANVGDKIDAKESDLRYFGLENIESFTGKLLDSVELESEGIGHRFQKDDVLFGKLRPYLAKVFLAQEEGLSSTEALVFRSSEVIYPKFLSYYCLSQDFINEVNGTTFGSKMPRASWDDISSFRMVYPSLDEQKIITDFLDKRLAQVDALITKQETLLEKLDEQRVSLISHAVTKGLNPDVEMKESDVVLLGNIPNTWNVKRLKFLLSEKLKYGANESAESDDKENPRYIRITDIDESGNLKDETFKSLESEKAQEYLLDDLDILLARSGATVGKSYLYKAESVGFACYAGYLIRARLDQGNYNPEFVNYFLQSKQYWDWISSVNIQATIQNVSAEKYNDLFAPKRKKELRLI